MLSGRLSGCLVVVLVVSMLGGIAAADGDGRLSSQGWDYYTVYCAANTVQLYLADGQLVEQIALPYILGIPLGGDWDLNNGMAVHREQGTVTITGSNGNSAPQSGSRTFSLTECLDRNGNMPQPAKPPDLAALEAATAAAMVTASTSNPCVHEVQAGETAYAIIAMYNMTLDELASTNDLLNPALLTVGQKLRLPGCAGVAAGLTRQNVTVVSASTADAVEILPADAVIHVVKAGEMLAHIALHYGVTVEAIINANDITDANMIWEGQELYIPGVSSE